MENGIFQKVRECPLHIAHRLHILHTKFKHNIAVCNLNVYQTSTK